MKESEREMVVLLWYHELQQVVSYIGLSWITKQTNEFHIIIVKQINFIRLVL